MKRVLKYVAGVLFGTLATAGLMVAPAQAQSEQQKLVNTSVTTLSTWLPIDRPVERSSMLDVTQLRPFLSWARKRSLAEGLALATGVAPVTPERLCPTGQLALLDGDAVTSTVAIE